VRYNSKSELLEHISEVTHEAMLQRMRTAADEEGSATDRLRGVVIAHVRFHAKYNTACRVANYELNSLEDDARERVRKLRQSMERVVSTLLAEGAENGEFAIDDRRVLTTFILSLGIDVARWFRAGHRLSPDELAEQYAGLLLRTVVKPKAARRATTRSSTG
jgi:AcrR family transcriptional regulator